MISSRVHLPAVIDAASLSSWRCKVSFVEELQQKVVELKQRVEEILQDFDTLEERIAETMKPVPEPSYYVLLVHERGEADPVLSDPYEDPEKRNQFAKDAWSNQIVRGSMGRSGAETQFMYINLIDGELEIGVYRDGFLSGFRDFMAGAPHGDKL